MIKLLWGYLEVVISNSNSIRPFIPEKIKHGADIYCYGTIFRACQEIHKSLLS